MANVGSRIPIAIVNRKKTRQTTPLKSTPMVAFEPSAIWRTSKYWVKTATFVCCSNTRSLWQWKHRPLKPNTWLWRAAFENGISYLVSGSLTKLSEYTVLQYWLNSNSCESKKMNKRPVNPLIGLQADYLLRISVVKMKNYCPLTICMILFKSKVLDCCWIWVWYCGCKLMASCIKRA